MGISDLIAMKNLIVLILLVLGISACDKLQQAEVNPIVELGQYYTIYGYLDVKKDTVYARVIPLRNTLVSTSPSDRTIDATVKLINKTANIEYTLRDSVVTAASGKIYHVFYVPLRASEGHTYRLEVKRNDGAMSWAETKAPIEPKLTRSQVFANFVGADNTPFYYTDLDWRNLDTAPITLSVWYRFMVDPRGRFKDVEINYPEVYNNRGTYNQSTSRWVMRIGLTQDRFKINELYGFDPTNYPLMSMGVDLRMRDEKWRAPNDVWDPTVLVEPAVLDNVENGFGFFGVKGAFQYEWAYDSTTTVNIGYSVP